MNYIDKPEKYYINKKIDQLKCFCLTAQYQTIKEAEKHDIYSQSTISMQIASLEYDLQTKLLQSMQKKLKLTKNGEEFYLKAQKILTKLTKFYLPSVSNLDLIKKPIHNYKKNKLEQIQSFCLVVENQNIKKVAIKTDTSEATIVMQLASLEYDLQTKLFLKPEKNQFILTKNGKYYYKFGRKILNDIAEFYSKPKIKIKNLFWLAINQKTKHLYNKTIKKIKTNFIKISLKKMIIIASILTIILSSSTAFYLNYTNYFFDKKIEKIANPLLKKLIKNGTYRMVEEKVEELFTGLKIVIDLDLLAIQLFKSKYDIKIILILALDNPETQLRMNNDEATNRKIFRSLITTQDIKKYNYYTQSSNLTQDVLKNYNYCFYNFYKNNNAINFDIFLENKNKYPDKIFDYYIPNMSKKIEGAYWIMKYNNYYYMAFENAMQADNMDNRERYFIWRKMTLKQLINHDSVGTLINDYNIKID